MQIRRYCSEGESHLMNRNVVPLGTKETESLEMVPKLVRPLEELNKPYSSQWSTSRTYLELLNYFCWANTPTVLLRLSSVCYYPRPECNTQYDMKTKSEKYFLLGKKIKYIITSIFKCAKRYTVFSSCCHFKNLQYFAFWVKHVFKSYTSFSLCNSKCFVVDSK